MKRKLLRLLRTYPLTLLCAVLVWYLCLLKPPSLRITHFVGSDKVAHVLMYLGLCGTLWWEYLRGPDQLSVARRVVCFVCLPVLMSGLIELLQEYATRHRSGDWYDLAANTLGILMAAALGRWVMPRLMKPRDGAK